MWMGINYYPFIGDTHNFRCAFFHLFITAVSFHPRWNFYRSILIIRTASNKTDTFSYSYERKMMGDLEYYSSVNSVGAAAKVSALRTPKKGEFFRSNLHKLGVFLTGMIFLWWKRVE